MRLHGLRHDIVRCGTGVGYERQTRVVREDKLFRLLPGRRESSRLDASGVALVDDKTALVVFDNLNQVARIDLSLKRRASNRLMPAPSLGLGFEDIAIDFRRGRVFCLIEATEDIDGLLRGFVAEYDRAGRFLRCTRLHTRFQEVNKGFEGLAHAWREGREFLYALCERDLGRSARGGRIDVFVRARDGDWKTSHRIRLPRQVAFKDYAALAYRPTGNLPSSRRSRRAFGWPGSTRKREPWCRDRDAVYRFPSKSYGNVEGIAWLSRDTVVAVSDRKKRQQPARCAEKD
jgi:hypothetical protein